MILRKLIALSLTQIPSIEALLQAAHPGEAVVFGQGLRGGKELE